MHFIFQKIILKTFDDDFYKILNSNANKKLTGIYDQLFF